jgi:hypothetical protein
MSEGPLLDRALGAIIGSALGDAIGLYTGESSSSSQHCSRIELLTFHLEFLTPKLALKAYPSQTFSLVDPVTPLLHDGHRSKFERVRTCGPYPTLSLLCTEGIYGRYRPCDPHRLVLSKERQIDPQRFCTAASWMVRGHADYHYPPFIHIGPLRCEHGLRCLNREAMDIGCKSFFPALLALA